MTSIISNVFKNPFADKKISYDTVEIQDISNNTIFAADYNYGSKDEQVIKKNIIIHFLQTILIRLCQALIYPGSNLKLDIERHERTKSQLEAIGGESITMKTPDGDFIKGMYLKSTNFKSSIEKYCYLFKSEDTELSTHQTLTIKKEFCIEKKCEETCSCENTVAYTKLVPNEEVQEFLEYLKGLKAIEGSGNKPLFNYEKASLFTSLFQKFRQKDKIRGFHLNLSSLPKDTPDLDETTTTSHPTVIIAGGSNGLSNSYKALATSYLLRGIDVMLVDFRGYGESTGNPTPYKTKLDLETAYQYLSKEQCVENKDLLVHGHCLGAGAATDLAARRKGVNILVDRSFAKYSNLAIEDIPEKLSDFIISTITWNKKESSQTLSKLISRIIPFSYIIPSIMEYDNKTNLKKVQGKIAFVIDTSDDETIPKEEINEQIMSCKQAKVIYTDIGHSENWINSGDETTSEFETTVQFNEFLKEIGLARRVF